MFNAVMLATPLTTPMTGTPRSFRLCGELKFGHGIGWSG